MPESMALENKTAIVTGASSGIDRAIAETLGAAGAHVTLVGRTVSAMDTSRKQTEESGGDARVTTADIRDPGEARAMVDGSVKETDELDIKVNIADITVRPPKRLDLG